MRINNTKNKWFALIYPWIIWMVEVAAVSQLGNHSFEAGAITKTIISVYNNLVRGSHDAYQYE